MPSVLSPTTTHSTKSYAPLADEVNPPFGSVAPEPLVTSNGTIVYQKRISPPGSSNTSDDERRSNRYRPSPLRSDSDDTLSSGRKGKGRLQDIDLDDEDGDLGRQQQRRDKGKERARDDDYESNGFGQSSYPPVNEVEEEEKRVQANLAKFAARETAKRKAARTSRIMPAPTGSQSAASSTSSLPRSRPLSTISESLSAAKRTSILGYITGGGRDRNAAQDQELSSPTNSSGSHAPSYNNPYDSPNQPRDGAVRPLSVITASPTMQGSSPFAGAGERSPSNSPSPTTPTTSQRFGGDHNYGYVGPGWRGGAGAPASADQPVVQPRVEKWWHALCAWGNDLDGGHTNRSNQAGRTNPFE